MTKRNEVYRCLVCGNIVEVLHSGKGELVCCGQPMELQVVNTVDASYEKHVPVVEKVPGGFKVKVGSTAHPMVPEHYIEWIELVTVEGNCRRFLTPDEAPEAEFMTDAETATAKAYCNLHGFWEGK
ncbi:MAG TPA: desulfoferrodoxin [Firmicutes bacterium]|nr:desulfoferrodoxin [Bacillota bacterium]